MLLSWRTALSHRNPHAILVALLGQQVMCVPDAASPHGYVNSLDLDELKQCFYALAAVCVPQAHWLPWWEDYFSRAAGANVWLLQPSRQPAAPLPPPQLSSHRHLAASLLRDLALAIRVQTRQLPKRWGASLTLHEELQHAALSAAVVLAPSHAAAVQLAVALYRRYGQEAAGCALAAYTTSTPTPEVEGPDHPIGEVRSEHAREALWLELWGRVQTSRSTWENAPVPLHPQHALQSAAVAHYTAWNLHCLAAMQRVADAAAVVNASFASALPPERLPLTAVAELLAVLPAATLATALPATKGSTTLRDQLAQRMFSQMQDHAPWHRVPIVSTHAVLYARLVEYVLAVAAAASTAEAYQTHLLDLQRLFQLTNVDALAASLVPTGQPLTAVMVATTDTKRAEAMSALGGALQRAIAVLSGGEEAHASGVGPHGRSSLRAAEDSVQRTTSEHRGRAVTQQALAEVELTLRLGVQILRDILVLCSSRSDTLPSRAAEPKWRRKLRESAAVRTHKYQLLLTELPHRALRDTLWVLLWRGYIEEGGSLGAGLVRRHQMDLRYYSLTMLGSLYHAIGLRAPSTRGEGCHQSTDGEVKTALRDLYRRRQEVYGESCLFVEDAALRESPEERRAHLASVPPGSSNVHTDLQLEIDQGHRSVSESEAIAQVMHSLQCHMQTLPDGRVLLACPPPQVTQKRFVGWASKGTVSTGTWEELDDDVY